MQWEKIIKLGLALGKVLLLLFVQLLDASSFSRCYLPETSATILSKRLCGQVRFCSKQPEKRFYSEEDLVSFPSLATPASKWPSIGRGNVFVPPTGKHYRHNRYNMNLYDPARQLFGDEAFRQVTSEHSNETYLFPGKKFPRLIKDFSTLPFSASGSLWAYVTETEGDASTQILEWAKSTQKEIDDTLSQTNQKQTPQHAKEIMAEEMLKNGISPKNVEKYTKLLPSEMEALIKEIRN